MFQRASSKMARGHDPRRLPSWLPASSLIVGRIKIKAPSYTTSSLFAWSSASQLSSVGFVAILAYV